MEWFGFVAVGVIVVLSIGACILWGGDDGDDWRGL